ncbi:hypothetical protein [Ensifer canadensis]
MIACYDAEGRITNIYHDPVPEELLQHLTTIGTAFVSIDSLESASDLARNVYIVDGEPTIRPEFATAVAVNGLSIDVSNIPAGSTVVLLLDAGTPLEIRHALTVTAGTAAITLDEAGPVRLLVTPPWPYLESTYDFDL